MKKKFMVVFCSMLMVLQLSACNTTEKTRYTAQFLELFDTMTQIVAYMDTKAEFTEFSNLVYNELEEYHQLYNIYDDFPGINNIKTINDNAGKQPVKVDQRIIDLLKMAKEEEAATNGTFNVALGAVLRIWHQYREEGQADPENARLPPREQLQAAMEHTDIDKVILDEEASTVFLADPEMSLDVGSVAKGYATEQVVLLAEKKGDHNALLSVGGNVRAMGDKGFNGESWNVGIQNPNLESEQKSLMTALLKEKSLVTSGVYERYYTVEGKNYHHIIDPATLMPSAYFKSVSIITKDSGKADMLTTALFNMPYEQGLAYIDDLQDVEAMWVMPDDEIRFSAHFEQYIK